MKTLFSIHFAANNPFTGTWYSVRFEDGRVGMIIDRHNGQYATKPDCGKVFTNPNSAAEGIYAELKRTNKYSCYE